MKKLFIILFVFIVGCATQAKYEAKLNTLLNLTKKDLVTSWGPPTSTYNLDKDTEFLTYDKSSTGYIPGSAYTSNSGYTTFGGGYYVNYNCKTIFTIEKSVITAWKIEGNNCKSK